MTVKFWTWAHGGDAGMSWSMPLWRLPYIKPMVRYGAGYPQDFGPPGVGSRFPIPSNDSEGIGTYLANWVQYFTESLAAVGVIYSDYCVMAQGIGCNTGGISEYIFGLSPDDDVIGTHEYRAFPTSALVEIGFGCKADGKSRASLRHLGVAQYPSVKTFDVQRCNDRLELCRMDT